MLAFLFVVHSLSEKYIPTMCRSSGMDALIENDLGYNFTCYNYTLTRFVVEWVGQSAPKDLYQRRIPYGSNCICINENVSEEINWNSNSSDIFTRFLAKSDPTIDPETSTSLSFSESYSDFSSTSFSNSEMGFSYSGAEEEEEGSGTGGGKEGGGGGGGGGVSSLKLFDDADKNTLLCFWCDESLGYARLADNTGCNCSETITKPPPNSHALAGRFTCEGSTPTYFAVKCQEGYTLFPTSGVCVSLFLILSFLVLFFCST